MARVASMASARRRREVDKSIEPRERTGRRERVFPNTPCDTHREESLRKQRGSMLEEDEQIQDSDIAIRQKSAQLDSPYVDDDELSDSPFKHVERRETIKERRKREGPRKKKLSKHIAKESAFLMELDALEAKELIDAACSNKTKKVLAIIKKSADGTPGAPSLDELFNTLHPQTGYAASTLPWNLIEHMCTRDAEAWRGHQFTSQSNEANTTTHRSIAVQPSIGTIIEG